MIECLIDNREVHIDSDDDDQKEQQHVSHRRSPFRDPSSNGMKNAR